MMPHAAPHSAADDALHVELARAAEIQAELLPRDCIPCDGFELAARCMPAREVGGDFYDWQQLPHGRLSLTVGDVMGRGMPAALLMASVRAVLRAVGPDASPASAVQWAATALEEDLTRSGSFVTLFHAHLDLCTSRLTFVDAGHGYVLLRRADGRIEGLHSFGLPLGVLSGEIYREGSVILHPGDTLVVYSDGLTEARPDLFSDPEIISAIFSGAPSAETLVQSLIEVATSAGPLPDDLTVALLHRTASRVS